MSIEHRTVDLACGGYVHLEVEADWLALSDDDAAFVRDLARRIDGYARPAPAAPDRSQARESFASHIDEMANARDAVA